MSAESGTFQFIRKSRFEGRYIEGERTLNIEVEPGGNSGLVIVYLSTARRWTDGRPLTDEERSRVQKNLEALDVGPYGKLDVC